MQSIDRLLIILLMVTIALEASTIIYSASLMGVCGKLKIISKVENPDISMFRIDCLNVTEDYTAIMLTAEMYNPNPYAITVHHVKISVYVNEIQLIRSINESTFRIEPLSRFKYVKIEYVRNDYFVDAILSHLSNGEESIVEALLDTSFSIHPNELRRFPFKAILSFKTDILGIVLSKINEGLPEDILIETPSHLYKLRIIYVHLLWGEVSESYVEVIGFARVKNIGDETVSFKEVVYEAILNNETIYREEKRLMQSISPRSICIIPLKFDIPAHVIKRAWRLHVKNNEKSILVLRAYLVFQGKEILLFERDTYIETDIFKIHYLK